MAGYYRDLDVDLTEALLLTDEFAPVNHLIRMGDEALRLEKPAPAEGSPEP